MLCSNKNKTLEPMNTCLKWTNYSFNTRRIYQHFLLCFCHQSSLNKIYVRPKLLQQRLFTKVYPTCLMYTVRRALCWLCRHKSRYYCGLYLGKLHSVYWEKWNANSCQRLFPNVLPDLCYCLSVWAQHVWVESHPLSKTHTKLVFSAHVFWLLLDARRDLAG